METTTPRPAARRAVFARASRASVHALRASAHALCASPHALRALAHALWALPHALRALAHALWASPHALRAPPQALRALAHALCASPHALRASAHALRASAHALRASPHALRASAHALRASPHALSASAHALRAPPHALRASAHALRILALCVAALVLGGCGQHAARPVPPDAGGALAAPDPADAAGSVAAARGAIAADRLGDAERWLKAALDRGAADPEVAIEYAKLLTRFGRHRDAAAVLEPRAGQDPRLLNLLGYAWLLAGERDRARTALTASIDRALALGRDYAPPHYHLGLLALAEGRLEDAHAAFRRAATVNPRHLEAHYQWIGTSERLGREGEAATARLAFVRLNRERLEPTGALDDIRVPHPYPVARGIDVETRVAQTERAFTRTFAGGTTVEVACRAPRGAAARFTASVADTGATLLDVVHEGSPERAEWVPHRLDLPSTAGDVSVRFEVRPASRWSAWLGGAAPDGAAFSEPAPLAAAASRSADPRPNILLIVLDTLRADAVGAAGGPAGVTPAFDRLAREGVRFARAESASSWTLPAHYSLFSGLTPLAHGVLPNLAAAEGYLFPDRRIAVKGSGRELMLAEALARAGYRTAAVTESGWVAPGFGLGQGFRVYRAALEGSLPGTIAGTLAELEHSGTRGPWFLFVHTYAPHTPYHAPREFRTRYAAAGHAGFAFPSARVPIEDYNRFKLPLFPAAPSDVRAFREIYHGQAAWSDTLVGEAVGFLRDKGLLEQTVVVVTSDHGEELFERGHFDHGGTLYEEVTRVPLVLSAPRRVPAGRIVDGPVSLVDVPATLLDLAGVGTQHGEGRSLLPLCERREAPGTRLSFAHLLGRRGELVGAVWQGSLKYVRTQTTDGHTEELFDLSADPGERSNLAGRRTADRARLAAAYDAHETQARKVQAALGSAGETLDPETLEQLKSLGYVQ